MSMLILSIRFFCRCKKCVKMKNNWRCWASDGQLSRGDYPIIFLREKSFQEILMAYLLYVSTKDVGLDSLVSNWGMRRKYSSNEGFCHLK